MRTETFEPPEGVELAAARALLAPWQLLTDPRIDGYGNLPADGRYLLVGNHTTLGVFDVPFVVMGIHDRTGVLVRSLGERLHFRVPLWRALLLRFGAVDGSRENARRLMRAGGPVLVFPGGGREVARRRGDYYPLVWRERIGFARLALEYDYPVVPFAMVGVDDMWRVIADADAAIYAPARRLARSAGIDPELLWPVVRGLGPTPLPRPQRIYARIGKPIEASAFGSSWEDAAGATALRDGVRLAVSTTIDELLVERDHDPARRLLPRLSGQAVRLTRSQTAVLRRLVAGSPRPGRSASG